VAIAIEGTSVINTTSFGTSFNLAINTGSHANRCVYVAFSHQIYSGNITSITLNGVALTSVYQDSATPRLSLYRISGDSNVPTGSATVSVNIDQSRESVMGIIALSGVDTTTPNRAVSNAVGSGTAPIVSGIVSNSGELLFGFGNEDGGKDVTGFGGGTSQWTQTSSFGTGWASTITSVTTSATMSWTISASAGWKVAAISIVPYVSPLSVIPPTGLVADYNPANITGSPANGDPVGTLPDSVRGFDATSSGSARPIYHTGGPNGYPYLSFDGATSYLKSGVATTVAQPYRAFIVFRPSSYGNGHRIFDGQATNQTVLAQYPIDINDNGIARGTQRYSLYAGSAYAATNPGGGLSWMGSRFGLVTALFSGASSSISINQNTPTTGSPGTLSYTGITLGSAGNFSSSLFAKYDFVRLLVYDSTIVSVSDVETALITQYDLSVPNLMLCDGDSLTTGVGSTAGQNYPLQLIGLLGSPWSVIETGVSGQTVVQMEADAATELDPQLNTQSSKKILMAWGGTNDMHFGADATTAYNSYVTYCTNRRAAGWTVVAFTVLPRSEATTPAGFEAQRIAFNLSVRSNWTTFADGICDCAADSRIGDSGDELNTTYYAGDKVHLNNTGYGIIASLVQKSAAFGVITASSAGTTTITARIGGITFMVGTAAGTSTMHQSYFGLAGTAAGIATTTGNTLNYLSSLIGFAYGGWAAGTVKLAWNANTEPNLAGYRIYIGTTPGVYDYVSTQYTSPVNVGLVTTYTFYALPGR
jgi:lysophospholipase L1-like esterase